MCHSELFRATYAHTHTPTYTKTVVHICIDQRMLHGGKRRTGINEERKNERKNVSKNERKSSERKGVKKKNDLNVSK